ncbi:MAG TPA: laminin B domain-containing protein [Phycisphaerales bacterium]|nr:laminin B domain-containing protein [Phycisphaerales bacterium]
MSNRDTLVALGVVAGMGGIVCADVISSTFDTDAEGWTVADAPSPVGQSTTGVPRYLDSAGNGGGFVTPPLAWPGDAFFVAPDRFLGDRSDMVGGFVAVDRRFFEPAFSGAAVQDDFAVDLTMTGASMTLAADLAPVPLLSWGTQSVSFTGAGGWFHLDTGIAATEVEIAAVLGDLGDIRVRGNLVEEGGRMGMDNFTLVPTPGSLVLFATSGLAVRRRRG